MDRDDTPWDELALGDHTAFQPALGKGPHDAEAEGCRVVEDVQVPFVVDVAVMAAVASARKLREPGYSSTIHFLA